MPSWSFLRFAESFAARQQILRWSARGAAQGCCVPASIWQSEESVRTLLAMAYYLFEYRRLVKRKIFRGRPLRFG
jgi:hypothetical protein